MQFPITVKDLTQPDCCNGIAAVPFRPIVVLEFRTGGVSGGGCFVKVGFSSSSAGVSTTSQNSPKAPHGSCTVLGWTGSWAIRSSNVFDAFRLGHRGDKLCDLEQKFSRVGVTGSMVTVGSTVT